MLSLHIYLSQSVHIYLFIYLSQTIHIYLSLFKSIYLCSYLSIYQFIHTYLNLFESMYLFIDSNSYMDKLRPRALFLLTAHLKGPIDQQMTSFCRIIYDVCLEWFGAVTHKKDKTKKKQSNRWQIQKGKLRSEQRMLKLCLATVQYASRWIWSRPKSLQHEGNARGNTIPVWLHNIKKLLQ